MTDTGIQILQWNISSFKVRNLELLSHIQGCRYDVIIFQETGIDSKDRAGINIHYILNARNLIIIGPTA